MPVITLEGARLSKEQKSQLVKELTASAAKIMNAPEQAYIDLIYTNICMLSFTTSMKA
jgi:4-oxalocrotonate tautomerase